MTYVLVWGDWKSRKEITKFCTRPLELALARSILKGTKRSQLILDHYLFWSSLLPSHYNFVIRVRLKNYAFLEKARSLYGRAYSVSLKWWSTQLKVRVEIVHHRATPGSISPILKSVHLEEEKPRVQRSLSKETTKTVLSVMAFIPPLT